MSKFKEFIEQEFLKIDKKYTKDPKVRVEHYYIDFSEVDLQNAIKAVKGKRERVRRTRLDSITAG